MDDPDPDELGTQVAEVAVAPRTFTAVADARVESANTTPRGSSIYLRAETTGTTGEVRSYVKFDVSGLGGTVRSARLRVYSSDGTDNGPKVYKATSNTWDEATLTWANKPGIGTTIGDDPAKVPSGGYVEWDVTSLVSGNGLVTFVFVADSADRWNGRSREDVNKPQLVIHTGTNQQTFAVAADARVNSEYPTVEYGTADYLWVRPLDTTNAWPDVRTFLRFTVSNVAGPVTNARVRLYNYDWASNGPRIYHVADDAWGETTINWNNKPARDAALLDDKGPVPAGTWYEWDVSGAVTGNGTYSFVLEGDPTGNSMKAWSKEHGSLAPQLVVLTGGEAPPPPPPPAVTARWPISNSTAPDADELGDAYGPRLNNNVHDFHAGIDIPKPQDTPIHAVLDGTVHFVDTTWESTEGLGGGKRVVLNHGGTPTRYTTYLHMNSVALGLDQGDQVYAGDVIGYVGKTGAQHDHLHFTYSVGEPGESYSRNPLEILPHTQPSMPPVTFSGTDVTVTLPVQQMKVQKITLEGAGTNDSRSVDYAEIVLRGNPNRDLNLQGNGLWMSAPANPSGDPKTFPLILRAGSAGDFVPTRLTLETFDGLVWEYGTSAASELETLIIPKTKFVEMFPDTLDSNSEASRWNYESFIAAAKTFPAFGNTGTVETRKREVAAFLANVHHETGGLRISTEDSTDPYCSTTISPGTCPAPEGYRGRGPLQLSWNYNYYSASQYLFGDSRLHTSPKQVADVPSTGWRASFWFWMYSPGASSGTTYESTAHEAMTATNPYGFYQTIKVINGSLECNVNDTSDYGERRQNRVNKYVDFTGLLGTPQGNMDNNGATYCPAY